MLLKLFHLSIVFINSYTIWIDQMYVDIPFPSPAVAEMPLKARHTFLTMWCLVLQIIYFAISFLNDVYGSNDVSPKKPLRIRRIKDTTFSVAFPMAIYVSSAFWGLYYINKDLIFPDEIEKAFPVWVNHVLHTLIVPFIFIELFVTRRNYPSRKLGISLILLIVVSYTVWMHILYFTKGVWVYPFLYVLHWTVRTLFCIGSACIGIVWYIIGEKINYLVSYRNQVNSNSKAKSK